MRHLVAFAGQQSCVADLGPLPQSRGLPFRVSRGGTRIWSGAGEGLRPGFCAWQDSALWARGAGGLNSWLTVDYSRPLVSPRTACPRLSVMAACFVRARELRKQTAS